MPESVVKPKKTAHGAAKHDAMVEKVRRLLALATSSNPHEAAAAAAKAEQLSYAYSIEQFELERAQTTHESLIREGWYNADKDQIDWQFPLFVGITQTNFCNAILYRNGDTPRYRLIGQPHHIEICVYIFDYLVNELDIYAEADRVVWTRRFRREHPGRKISAGDITRWNYSFLGGAAEQIVFRLVEAFKAMQAAYNESTALTIYNDQALKAFYEQENIRYTDWNAQSRPVDAAAYLQGAKRGSEIDIDRRGLKGGPATPESEATLRISTHTSI